MLVSSFQISNFLYPVNLVQVQTVQKITTLQKRLVSGYQQYSAEIECVQSAWHQIINHFHSLSLQQSKRCHLLDFTKESILSVETLGPLSNLSLLRNEYVWGNQWGYYREHLFLSLTFVYLQHRNNTETNAKDIFLAVKRSKSFQDLWSHPNDLKESQDV